MVKSYLIRLASVISSNGESSVAGGDGCCGTGRRAARVLAVPALHVRFFNCVVLANNFPLLQWKLVASRQSNSLTELVAWTCGACPFSERKERQESIKLLRKVELIATEVAVRLMHLETQAKELVEYEARKAAGEEEEEDPAANSSLNSYYHFDSQGNKLKTKWDSYDVDAELERLEQEERGESAQPTAAPAKKPTRKTPQITRSKALASSQGIEHEFEAVLSFLDDIRGDDEVKQLRKAIANKVTKEYFARIDAIQAMLA
ncbi:unnamed protein product [Phytophthora lilii]|uniref:Unnamed protein product n=1 Tax=Phytophthora lilii TaxID=2077276 RepID=A0A9W6TRD8_9STRA|nr:unnamed protein product [Phytophthora lilii]